MATPFAPLKILIAYCICRSQKPFHTRKKCLDILYKNEVMPIWLFSLSLPLQFPRFLRKIGENIKRFCSHPKKGRRWRENTSFEPQITKIGQTVWPVQVSKGINKKLSSRKETVRLRNIKVAQLSQRKSTAVCRVGQFFVGGRWCSHESVYTYS